MFEKHNIFHEVCWMSYCKIKMISKNQKYELEANSTDRSLANICVAGIGNFNERSLCWNRLRTLALGSFMSYFCRDILASDIIIFVLVFPIFKVKCFLWLLSLRFWNFTSRISFVKMLHFWFVQSVDLLDECFLCKMFTD